MLRVRIARVVAGVAIASLGLVGFVSAPAAAADPTYSISGIVRDSNGVPVAAGSVHIYVEGIPFTSQNAETQAGGVFTVNGLFAGTYYLHFTSPDYQDVWLGGSTSMASFSGNKVVVAANVSGIDQTVPPTRQISGTVTDVTGNPILANSITVRAGVYGAGTAFPVQAGGAFVITGLDAGTYTLHFESPDYLDNWLGGSVSRNSGSGDPVTVGPSDVSGLHQVMTPSGSISGRVSLGEAGNYAGAGQVKVTASLCGSRCGPLSSDVSTLTAADGTFTLSGLESEGRYLQYKYVGGPTYTLVDYDASRQYYPHPWEWVFTNADALIPHAGQLSGHVELSPGVSAGAGVEVWVASRSVGSQTPWSIGTKTTVTDSAGDYQLSGLLPLEHRITFIDKTDPTAWTQTEYGFTIGVDSWDLTHDVDFSAGGRIYGHVTNSSGAPFTGATVRLAMLVGSVYQTYATATVGSDGDYEFRGLPFREIYVSMIGPDGYVNVLWSPRPGNGEGFWAPVTVGPDDVLHADATLSKNAVITVPCPGCSYFDLPELRLQRHDPVTGAWWDSGFTVPPGEYRLASHKWDVGGYEWSTWSPTFTVTEDVNLTVPAPAPDRFDLVVRTTSGTVLRYEPKSGKLGSPTTLGTISTSYNRIFDVNDITGDGVRDLVATTKTGSLDRLDGIAGGGFLPGVTLSSGWNSYRAITVHPEFTDDGNLDIIAQSTGGALYVIPGDGWGGFAEPRLIGDAYDWGGFTKFAAVDDWDDDGFADLVAVTASGTAYLFMSPDGRMFSDVQRVWSGLKGISQIVTVGDFDKDFNSDVVALNSAGDLVLLRGDHWSKGTKPVKLASGWKGKLLA